MLIDISLREICNSEEDKSVYLMLLQYLCECELFKDYKYYKLQEIINLATEISKSEDFTIEERNIAKNLLNCKIY